MKRNLGAADSLVRIILALAIAVLYFTNLVSGTLAVALTAVAIVFLVTGIFGRCPLYSLLGFSTIKK